MSNEQLVIGGMIMAKIEKDRPLPSHTKLDYDECYAKIVLEKFFPDQYENLQISDKPDLRDISNNIGIFRTLKKKNRINELPP